MRRRGELLERTFAHCLETGGMRRLYLRGRENILKRYLIHVAGFNLSLIMRTIFGVGTPRGLQGRLAALFAVLRALPGLLHDWITSATRVKFPSLPILGLASRSVESVLQPASSTGS